MKFKVILCVTLLALIALGGLNDVIARMDGPSKKSHSWQELKLYPTNILRPSTPDDEVFLLISFKRIPFFIIYFQVLQTSDIERPDPKEVNKKRKENKDVGANKNYRRD